MREGFFLGPIFVHWYGVIIMFGAVLAAFLADYEARRRKLETDIIWDVMPWLLIAGVIGARIWHILTPSETAIMQGKTTLYFLTHPLDAINIRSGGLGIPGAVIGGALALYFYCRKKKASFSALVDTIAPGLALAQSIGRWGNYINQELYGAPTNLPWAIFIEPRYRLPGFQDVAYYHPMFLYESIWNLLNMFVLLWLSHTERLAGKLKSGDIFLVYLIIYPVGRFFLEFIRLDASTVGGFNANQMIMAVVALSSAAMLIWRHSQKSPQTLSTEVTADNTQQESVTSDHQ